MLSELDSIFTGEGACTQGKQLFFAELHFKPDSSPYIINNYSKENRISHGIRDLIYITASQSCADTPREATK